MPRIAYDCSKEEKNAILDHISKCGYKYRNSTDFIHRAIEDQIKADRKDIELNANKIQFKAK